MSNDIIIPSLMNNIKDVICNIRGQYVILDADVAHIYGVETRRINEAVRNNLDKFPKGYMFTLEKDELN